ADAATARDALGHPDRRPRARGALRHGRLRLPARVGPAAADSVNYPPGQHQRGVSRAARCRSLPGVPSRHASALRPLTDGLRRRARIVRRLYREVGGRVIAYVAVARVLPERVGRVEWFTVMEYPIERDVPLDDLHYRWAGREDVALLTAFG